MARLSKTTDKEEPSDLVVQGKLVAFAVGDEVMLSLAHLKDGKVETYTLMFNKAETAGFVTVLKNTNFFRKEG